MQQADCANSATGALASPGNINGISAPTRRGLIGVLAAAGVVALAAPIAAASVTHWDAGDWAERWSELGCGLEVSGNALHLKARLNGDRAAISAMMAEIAPVERQTALLEILRRFNAFAPSADDPALRAIREIEAIDAEFISEDVNPVGHAAWLERWDRAFDRLPLVPATTSRGRAAKLRYAIEYMDTPRGDQLMQQTLRYMESLS